MNQSIRYQIIRSNRKSIAIQIKRDGQVVVRAPHRISDREIQRFVIEKAAWIQKGLSDLERQKEEQGGWPKLTDADVKELSEQAKRVIPPRVEYYARRIGVTYGRISIRCQKTRWGSCSSSGNLNFNCLLMLTPPEVIDSVIVHELCHRKQMNHSKKFYEEVYKAFPQYDLWHGWLKENGNTIMRRRF